MNMGHRNANDVPTASIVKPTATKSPLRFTMFADIDPSPQKVFLVDGFLGAGEASCIFGAPGTAKSMLAVDMSCHIAAGVPWFGRTVQRGAVLYVAAERAALTARRLAAFRKYHCHDDLPLAVVAGSVDLRSNAEHVALLVDHARDLKEITGQPVVLIVIDTISRVLNGGDENSPKDMGALVANVARLQEATGAHVLVIHHIPQDGNVRLRGHGALLGALDTTIALEKTGTVRTASIIKDNDGAEDQRIAFDLKGVVLSTDTISEQETTAPVVVPADAPPPAKVSRAKLPQGTRMLLTTLSDMLADRGRTIRPFPSGPEVKAVERGILRTEFFSRWPTDGDTPEKQAEAKRKQFARSERDAIARNAIVARDVSGETLIWKATA